MSCRLVPVRLAEVRLEVRVSAALKEGRRDEQAREELLLAALQPSRQTYYLPETVRPLIERYAA